MSDIPRWCRVGAKVTYIGYPNGAKPTLGEVGPVLGSVYTIRWVGCDVGGMPTLRLVEIVNAPRLYGDIGFQECMMRARAFRPLVSQADDLEAHFSQLLIVSTPQTVEA